MGSYQAVFSILVGFSNLSFSLRSIARFCDAVYGGESVHAPVSLLSGSCHSSLQFAESILSQR
jgi:hypothetical protein